MIDWSAPSEPGVYLFKNSSGEIVYVGKAKSLSNRLANYRANNLSGKTAELMKQAVCLEVIACRNESEALVLENTLIKQHRPRFNVDLKDNVYYAYLKITNEEFPRILVTRKKSVLRGEKLLGPFVSGFGRSVALREASRLFGIRTCKTLPKQACLQYHLGFCSAPCIGKISKEEYAKNVKSAQSILQGETGEVEARLKGEMKQASERMEYERAKELRDRINGLQRIKEKQLMESNNVGSEDFFGFVQDGEQLRCCVLLSRNGLIAKKDSFSLQTIGESPQAELLLRYYETRPLPQKVFALFENGEEVTALRQILSKQASELFVPVRGDKLSLVKLAEKNAAMAVGVAGSSKESLALQKALGLSKPPAVIDCFDASNFYGKQLVGSCVRLVDGKPEKSSYRRFRIKSVSEQDDFASMREIVFRRYRAILEKGEKQADLVLIDGGVGQLHAALQAFSELGIEPPIAALAKREEEVFLPDLLQPLKLQKNHDGLKLLMRCRDEAHRFAIAYNRKRRRMESSY